MINLRALLIAALVGFGIGTFSPSASATTHAVLTPPKNISTDCSSDVSARLQTFLQRVPDNSRVEFDKGACYRIDRPITVASARGVSIDGMNASLRRPDGVTGVLGARGGNPMFRLLNVHDVTVQRLHVSGWNTVSDKVKLRPKYGAGVSAMEADHGILLQGVHGVTLQNITVDAVFGDGVYIGGSDVSPQSSSVLLRRVKIDRNGRQGVAITSARDVLLDNVNIAHSRRAGVDLEPHPDSAVARVEIRDSQIASWLHSINGAGTGSVNDVYVHDNVFLRSAIPVIYNRGGPRAQPRSGWDVIDNSIAFTVRSSAPAMLFGRTSDVLVHGNDASFSLGSGLAVIAGSSTVTIQCNRFAGAVSAFVTNISSRIHLDRNVRSGGAPTCTKPAAPAWAEERGAAIAPPKGAKATTAPTKPNHSAGGAEHASTARPHDNASPPDNHVKQCRQDNTSAKTSHQAQTSQPATRIATVATVYDASSRDLLILVAVAGMFGVLAFTAGIRTGRRRPGRHAR